MKVRFSRFRTFLLTFTFGLASFSAYMRLADYFEEIPVDLPQVNSDSPIIIRVCPDWRSSRKGYEEEGSDFFEEINCIPGGGGGG